MNRILVTGANRTLGRALAARLFHDPQCLPILSARNAARILEAFPGLPITSIEALDFAAPASGELFATMAARLTPLSAMVHCASYYGPNALLTAPETELDLCLAFLANTLGLVQCAVKAFGDAGGRIILVGSVAADSRRPSFSHGLYSFFKGSLREICRQAAPELARRQSTITYLNLGSIQPGDDPTPGDRSHLSLTEVTDLICDLLTKPSQMRLDHVDCFPLGQFDT